MKIKELITISLVIAMFFPSCTSDGGKTDNDNPNKIKPPVKTTVQVQFNGDSAYKYVAEQVAFGPRIPRTSAHAKTLNYLRNKLSQFCDTAYIMSGNHTSEAGQVYDINNIIGQFNPRSKQRFVLAAHWDTRSKSDEDKVNPNKTFDGANDGASGVGVLLEIARQLQTLKPKTGVDIIFFDREDDGNGGDATSWCLGSQYWGNWAMDNYYVAQNGILLDMVGAKDATFAYEGFSAQFNQNLMLKIWNTAADLGYGSIFLKTNGSQVTDDHYYMSKYGGVPSVDIIHYNPNTRNHFPDHWHTQQDNMSVIDKNTLSAVGHTVLHVVVNH
ncbi:MAG: M28 family peptidase [Flavobacteriales bacterium]|nr:M28 family peptidase [Flavobacteriales bacterium]